MTVERIVRIIAGFFIMLSLALAYFNGAADLSHLSWLWFTAFVGLNLFQSGFTRFCPMDTILKRFGTKESCSL
jgi:Inner membrane protein YgaP-like, transmembrane domain